LLFNLPLLEDLLVTMPAKVSGASAAATSAIRKYPNSYLAQTAFSRAMRESGDSAKERAAIERAVRSSPGNAQPWLSLGRFYANSAEKLRQGRVASAISRQEWTTLTDDYARDLAAVTHAAACDDKSSHVWFCVAEAATFAGADALAVKAYDKSIALNSNSFEMMNWSKEMFQPKWLNDETRLKKALDHIYNATYNMGNEAVHMADVISSFGPDGTPIKKGFELQQRNLIKARPERLQPYINLGFLYEHDGRHAEAARMYEQIVLRGLHRAVFVQEAAKEYRAAGDAASARRVETEMGRH
jgi:tetratricopeptide (TPR) repeat protein